MLHSERAGAGPRLVLVHGFTQTSRCWGPLAGDLARTHEVVGVDLPGHGGSGGLQADLPEAAALVGEAGGRAIYLGYSLGGRVLLHLALARPDLVRGLVLIGVTAGIEDPVERAARRAADEERAAHLEEVGVKAFLEEWLAQPLFAGLPPEAACRAERRRNTVAGLAGSLRRCGTGTQEPLWDRLAGLGPPTLVVAGANDVRFAALGRRLADRVGPGARLALVAGAGHAAHLERPAATLAVLRPWLSTLEGQGSR